MSSLEYYPAAQVDFEAFTAAFNLAYQGYCVPISMTVPSFRALIARDDLDLGASVAAVDGRAIVGMAMLGIRGPNGWIGGVGVIPSHRRRGIARQMMHYLLDRARERSLTLVNLEVIEQNTGAYALYRDLGFVDTRYLMSVERNPDLPIQVQPAYPVEACDPARLLEYYAAFHDVPNCWQRALPSLRALAPHLDGWAVYAGDQIVGYALGWANADAIRLLDIASAPAADRVAVAQALLTTLHRQHPAAHGSHYNVNENDPALVAHFALGYVTAIRQIEMRYSFST